MTLQIPTPEPLSDAGVITAELVAKTIASISLIGVARRTLEQAGYTAKILANRITVDGVIEAQLVSTNGHARWEIYAIDGTPPVWTVGGMDQTMSDWTGCVE